MSRTPIIIEWENGNYGHELVEVTHEQASKIVQYFRDKLADGADVTAGPDS